MGCLLDMCMTSHAIFWFSLCVIGVLYLCILAESVASVWYMDGLKIYKSTGASVCCPDQHLGYFWSLGNFSTVFLAEVFAILICCRISTDKGYKGRCIHICLDKQAALLALRRYNFTFLLSERAIPYFLS